MVGLQKSDAGGYDNNEDCEMSTRQQLQSEYLELVRKSTRIDDYFALISVSSGAETHFNELSKAEDEADGITWRSGHNIGNDQNANDALVRSHDYLIRAIPNAPSLRAIDVETYPGMFPTGSVNAQTRRVNSGILILIDHGLFSFTTNALSILLRYDAVQDALITVKQDRRWNRNLVVQNLGELLAMSVVNSGIPLVSEALLMHGGHLGILYELLAGEILCFVLAHELSHAAFGHLGAQKSIRSIRTPMGDQPFIVKEWTEEMAADIGGLELTFVRDRRPEAWEETYQSMLENMPFSVAGVTIFFIFDDMITRLSHEVAKAIGRSLPIFSNHPPSQLRLENIYQYLLSRQASEGVFSIAECFTKAVVPITADTISIATGILVKSLQR